MKTINNRFFLFGLAMIVACFAGSCDNDDQTPVVEPATDYAGIQLQHIKALESEMTSAEIQASNASEILFKEGDVFVYLSSEGNYGKFKILKIFVLIQFLDCSQVLFCFISFIILCIQRFML